MTPPSDSSRAETLVCTKVFGVTMLSDATAGFRSLPPESPGFARFVVIGKRTCPCRGHRPIVVMAQKLGSKTEPRTSVTKIERGQRVTTNYEHADRVSRTMTSKTFFIALNQSMPQCRQLPGSWQHSSCLRIKAMPFATRIDIKVIYFRSALRHVADDGYIASR